jgi:hypothetical protein
VIVAGLACGAAVWALSIPLTGQREPFDSASLYYPMAMFIAGAVAALPAPRYWWLAVMSVFLGEHLYAFAAFPDTRAWFLFGIIVNALIPTWWSAAVGAALVYGVNRWRERLVR